MNKKDEEDDMKKILLATGAMVLVLMVSIPAFCGDLREARYERGYGGCGYGPGTDWGGGPMMGPGYGAGMHRGGWGMHGRGHMMDRGWRESPRDWESIKPEQREEWQKMRSNYRMETLELRKELAAKQIELETLWDQPDVDQDRVEKLSDEVADLQAELEKKRDKYLLQCRKQFGDKGWVCPGGRW
jgi:hypothetical protein